MFSEEAGEGRSLARCPQDNAGSQSVHAPEKQSGKKVPPYRPYLESGLKDPTNRVYSWCRVSRPTVIAEAPSYLCYIGEQKGQQEFYRSPSTLSHTVTRIARWQERLLKPSKMKVTLGFGSWLYLSVIDTGSCTKSGLKQDPKSFNFLE